MIVVEDSEIIDKVDTDLKKIRGMRKKLFYSMRGLTEAELEAASYNSDDVLDCPTVGLVRVGVEGADKYWFLVEIDELSVQYCNRHSKPAEMKILRVATQSMYNVKGALFYQCDRKIGEVDKLGNNLCCEENVYIACPEAKFREDQNSDPWYCKIQQSEMGLWNKQAAWSQRINK